MINGSNFTYQVVFVNTNLGLSTDVRFEPATDLAIPVIQWLAIVTNAVTGQVSINTLYLSDSFGAFTNFQLVTNSSTLAGVGLSEPENYTFQTIYGGTSPSYTNFPHGDIPYLTNNIFNATSKPETNQYTVFGVTLAPVTIIPDPTLTVSLITNLPGRISLRATNFLDLSFAKVTGANYLSLSSTNHFAGSPFAQIESPNMDVNVGTTNGMLFITNLVAPYLPRFNGTIDTYSARWTNIVGGITNAFHILMVDSKLSATASPLVQNFFVRSTNVYISDFVNVASNLLINATSLTITSNDPAAPTPIAGLNLISPNIIWSNSLPGVQFLTNWGIISVPNTTYFADVENPPYFTNSLIAPYQALVNHGTISTSGNTIWANYFENTGSGITTNTNTFPITISTNFATIASSFGPISIQSPTALMVNSGVFVASGSLSITAGNLNISNETLHASGALTFSPTNQFNGSGSTWTNVWSVGNGFNLLVKPPTGDLLGTVITDSSPVGVNKLVSHTWAGNDFGPSTAGFFNNVAIGQLILDGQGVNCSFYFTGTGAQNALYVDQIVLKDFATNNVGGIPNVGYTALTNINTNMTIYFADAIAGNQDISERLDGQAGGRLRWVPSFAGVFSGTNVVMHGVTNALVNRALVTSQDIDSNGSSMGANYYQLLNGSYPVFTSGNVNLTVAMTNQLGTKSMAISWEALYNSTNFLRYKTNFTSTNWVTLTNFIQGPVNSRVTVTDPVQINGRRFYKVEIDPQQP